MYTTTDYGITYLFNDCCAVARLLQGNLVMMLVQWSRFSGVVYGIWQIYAYMMKPIYIYIYIYLYADDAKIYKHVFSKAVTMSLSKLHDWSNTSLLSLNAQKCKVVSLADMLIRIINIK